MRFGFTKQNINKKDFSDVEFDLPSVATHELPFGKSRTAGIALFFVIIGIVLLGEIASLQIIEADAMRDKYKAIHLDRDWILPPRGLIFDANGVELAVNGPGRKENEVSRIYPQGQAFSHLLGFIGRVEPYHLSRDDYYIPQDFVGKMGIEASYESFLRGEHGSVEKPVRVEKEIIQPPLITPAKPGNNVTLSIDSEMQKKLYEEIKITVEEFNSPGGAGVIIDPSSGAIRALVSIPSFDNNKITSTLLQDTGRPLFNRAIAGEYPSGSTIKPFLASAALAEGIIAPETVILDRGVIEVPSVYDPSIIWRFRGWKALGQVSMKKAIAMSSNVYFYIVGGGYKDIKGLGISRINRYLELYGWNQRSGIDIEGERIGFLPTPEWKKQTLDEQWFIGDTYNSSIGQGFTRVTPLQLAVATNILANGGTLYEPYLVERIESQEGQTIFKRTPAVIRKNFIEPSFTQIVREGMREAVLGGTVWRLKDLPLAVAAKTGTAQAGGNRPHHGWITLFAPYENPEITLTILIENGEGGEQSAVPTAKRFLEWYAQEKSVQDEIHR